MPSVQKFLKPDHSCMHRSTKPFNMWETLYMSDINERKRVVLPSSKCWLNLIFGEKALVICEKKKKWSFPWEHASFLETFSVSLHMSVQREAGGKGAQQRNRQTCPDRSGIRFTSAAWITEIRELGICLPASSTTELFIHLERGFIFCAILFCF